MRYFFFVVMIAIALVGALSRPFAHEMMGKWSGSFLYGRYVGDPPTGGLRNCCTHGDSYDCKTYPEEDVRIVPGGYLLADGEFISHQDTNVSPIAEDGQYYYYRCQHGPDWQGTPQKSHCFFAPPRGT